MSAKLFTIGDSISQGFMSGAAASPHLSYSTILADALNFADYRYLKWDERYKMKIDCERILRSIEKKYGSNIRGLEWGGVLSVISNIIDQSEDYFERGPGKIGNPVDSLDKGEGFHNVAVEGMNVADAFLVTPRLCREKVEKSTKTNDGFFTAVSCPFYRNAYRVLNPKGNKTEKQYNDYSAVSWLEHIAKKEGVENVLLWLGANNALGTVLSLDIKQTPNNPSEVISADRDKRSSWNLWHPNDFKEEYKTLLEKIIVAMKKNQCNDWHVFIGTIPLVTIAPIAKGVGGHRIVKDPACKEKDCLYYRYYTYFPLTLESGLKAGKYLKFSDALFIDKTILEFNEIIRELVEDKNKELGRDCFHIVDVCKSLSDMAWKRNMGKPPYKYPDELEFMYPPVNTKYYHVNKNGEMEKGGIFSLDGVHPSAIGQGLIAWEFLKVIQDVHKETMADAHLNWDKILASDTLREKPITLMEELYEHEQLINLLVSMADILGIKD